MKKRKNEFIVIDGNSLLNRAYYAVQRPMITKEGMYTQGIYGFLNMLLKLQKDYEPAYMAVAFDLKGPTFRHEEYKEYKAGRKKMPMELAMEFPILKDILSAMNIPCLEKQGFEADDIIGTLTLMAEKEGLNPLVISGDKDQLQLVSQDTRVLFTKRGVSVFDMYDMEKMEEVYGFGPKEFIDLKALMGDKSDNIPGVMGVGEKTASKLIVEYGSIENIYENIENIKPVGLKTKLENNKMQAFMSKSLATIFREVPIEIEVSQCKFISPDYKKLIPLYEKLEFKNFLSKLSVEGDVESSESKKLAEMATINISSNDEFDSFVSYFEKSNKEIGIRVYSDFSHVKNPSIDKIAVAIENKVYEIDTTLTEKVIDFLMREKPVFFGNSLKDDFFALMGNGFLDTKENTHIKFDTKVGYYLVSGGNTIKTIEELGLKYGFPNKIESSSDYFSMIKYIGEKQAEEIEEKGLDSLYNNIELPLVRVMAQMEHNGFSVDKEALRKLGDNLKAQIDVLTEKIYEQAGEEFNIASPVQLSEILFEKLNLTKGKKTKKGYSTSADVLEKIRDEHEIIPMIMEYRGLTKLNSTYVEGLMPLVAEDGRIHGSFNQTVTATGRISSSNPNMQNIPVKTEIGRDIRGVFVPSSKEQSLIGADYSQIELRVLAHMSKDGSLLEAFNKGEDIHRATAARVLGVEAENVTPIERSKAKAINFGVIYGMSGFGLSEELAITRKEADKYIKEYFSKHEAVKVFMDEEIKKCSETGYVKTIMNRLRYINEIKASNFMVRKMGERLAMNTPIQGSAADIIKASMIDVAEALDSMESKLILQVHDELIVEVAQGEEEQVEKLLYEKMENAVNLSVKLAVDVNKGMSWKELK